MLVRVWSCRDSHSLLAGTGNGRDTLEESWQFLKTKHTLAVLYSNHTPLYPPKGVENLGLHKTCTWMFIAALFKAAKTWKQPRCLSAGEWISHL